MNSLSVPNHIPVLLCFDANYADYAAVATYSAHKNSKSNIVFYWLFTPEVEERSKRLRESLQKLGMRINLLVFDVSHLNHWKTGLHFTTASYLRLFAPDLLTNEDKLLYLDCDTLVLTDVMSLYNTPLQDARFAGCIDETGGKTSRVPRVAGDKYINSGVLLMDLKALRNDGVVERCKMLYEQFKNEITWPDQCLINKYAEGRKLILDPKYNRQIFTFRIKASDFNDLTKPQNSSILHFVGGTKPWQSWCNPCIAEFWWAYANDLQIDNLKPTQITTINQLVALADVLDLNSQYEEASKIKTQAIQALFKHLAEINSRSN